MHYLQLLWFARYHGDGQTPIPAPIATTCRIVTPGGHHVRRDESPG